jgi:hypothetical protein
MTSTSTSASTYQDSIVQFVKKEISRQSKMKFFAIPALLAAAAQAVDLSFLNDIPVEASYKISTDFVLEWKNYDASPTDTFQLSLTAWNNTPSGYQTIPFGGTLPIYDTIEIVLAG